MIQRRIRTLKPSREKNIVSIVFMVIDNDQFIFLQHFQGRTHRTGGTELVPVDEFACQRTFRWLFIRNNLDRLHAEAVFSDVPEEYYGADIWEYFYEDLKIILIEAAPRDKDMEWDRVIGLWQEWFDSMEIGDYEFVKRMALSKEKDMLREIVEEC